MKEQFSGRVLPEPHLEDAPFSVIPEPKNRQGIFRAHRGARISNSFILIRKIDVPKMDLLFHKQCITYYYFFF